MERFIALCCFILALLGWSVGGTTLVHRASANGSDVLYSRTQVQAGVARFECVRSESGQCHYLVYPRGCGPGRTATPAGCDAGPVRDFAVARGDSRRVVGLRRDFILCVSADAAAHGGCEAVEPAAARLAGARLAGNG